MLSFVRVTGSIKRKQYNLENTWANAHIADLRRRNELGELTGVL